MHVEDDIKSMARIDGAVDVPCPTCGPTRKSPANRKRPVLRIWNDAGFITYSCARCGLSGWIRGEASDSRVSKPRPVQKRDPERSHVPAFLWDRGVPMLGTIAETYLRSRNCLVDSDNLRFLPPAGDHNPAMMARFGSDGPVIGIHLTKLAPSGAGKAGTEKDKIMIGAGTAGLPIVVNDRDDRTELLISEAGGIPVCVGAARLSYG